MYIFHSFFKLYRCGNYKPLKKYLIFGNICIYTIFKMFYSVVGYRKIAINIFKIHN